MLKNKKRKLAVLSLLGVLMLTGCSEDVVYSKPSTYDDKIITVDGATETIHHNVLSIIYDAMHEGKVSSNVLDEAMYRYASSVFGTYNKVTKDAGSEEVTLKDAYKGTLPGASEQAVAKTKQFIKDHKAYWYYNEDGKHVKLDSQTGQLVVIADGEDWDPGQTEFDHVESKWLAIEDRIAEAMYEKVNSGSYTKKNYFNEERLLKSLHRDGKKVKNYLDTTNPIQTEEVIIPYTVEESDIFDEFTGFDNQQHIALHRAYYQDSIDDNVANPQYTYIEDEIIPSVYNDLLIEQYLLDEDVAAVRNSRARFINVLKIEKYSTFTNNADLLVKELLNEIYTVPAAATQYLRTDADVIEEDGDRLFQKYALVAKGLYKDIQANAAALAIVTNLQAKASDIYEEGTTVNMGAGNNFSYYKNTTAGDLAESYDKLQKYKDNWELLDSSTYSTFTSSGTRTVKEGYEQQLIDIMQKENITKGWYIQSKTAGLDSNGEINKRLFTLSVANAKIELDTPTDNQGQKTDAYLELEAADRIVRNEADTAWVVRDEASPDENKYLCSINGAYYLKFDNKSADSDWKENIVYDDGSAYYIVQVFEAAKDSKLKNVSQTNYAHTRSQTFMDKVIDEVAKIVGSTGSYSSLSKNHWLDSMNLKYYDQKVYDYFVSNYPELFED